MNDRGLLDLGALLQQRGYAFVQPSVADIKRHRRQGGDSGDVLVRLFGWGLPVAATAIDSGLAAAMDAAGVLQHGDQADSVSSAIRCASVSGALCFHTAGPGAAQDAVFVGPDTYHFIDMLEEELAPAAPVASIVEVGCGSGAASIWLARRYPQARIVACDINPAALHLAEINRRLAGVDNLHVQFSDVLADVAGEFDLIVSNPPFIADEEKRVYRDGGGLFGLELPLKIVEQALTRLRRGGRMLMYTVSPFIGGRQLLASQLDTRGIAHTTRVLAADVCRDLLDLPAYEGVEAIASLMLTVPARAAGSDQNAARRVADAVRGSA